VNLVLHLTPELESRLREWANVSGKNPETLALDALQEKLSDGNVPLPQSASLAEFQSWFASHPCSETRTLDDSRERVYEGCGE